MFEKILFPVKKEKIEYAGKDTGRSMIIREDTNEFVSVVSDDYLLIPNKLVIDSLMDEFHKIIDGNKNPQIFCNGSYTSVSLNLNFPTEEVKVGDHVGAVIRVENSYDTTKALKVSMNALRLVCSNGMTVNKPLFQSKVKHIGQIKAEDVVNDMLEKINSNSLEQFQQLNNQFAVMARTKITPEIKKKFVKELSKHPNYVVDRVIQQIIQGKPKDLWELYNCVTYVTTHQMDRNQHSTLKTEEALNEEILKFL